jgi:hypothetical protein
MLRQRMTHLSGNSISADINLLISFENGKGIYIERGAGHEKQG